MPTILIVDDDPGILKTLELILKNRNLDVKVSMSTNNAIELLTNHKIDLVITDLMMPDRDGYELLDHIRKVDEKLPVIILTSKTQDFDRELGHLKGVNKYLTKPICPVTILGHISSLLGKWNINVL